MTDHTPPAAIAALTICEPYAWLIANNDTPPPKRVENRHARFPRLRDVPLLIHSGRSTAYAGAVAEYRHYGIDVPDFEQIVGRGLIGICRVVDTVDVADVPRAWRTHQQIPGGRAASWIEGPRCLLLRDVYAFDQPIDYRGQQGVFYVPADQIGDQWFRWQERLAIQHQDN